MPKIPNHVAEQQVEDDRWQCLTCSAPAAESSDYCRPCQMHWRDARELEYDTDWLMQNGTGWPTKDNTHG